MGCILSKACHNTPIMIGKRVDSPVKRFEDNHFSCLACCKHASMCNKNLSCDGTIMPTLPSTLPRDCSELKLTNRHNGSYTIYPHGVSNISTNVYCYFDSDGAWTVIQSRLNGSVDFYRNWTEYQRGFGSSDSEYWLGNDIIHQLTSLGNYTLKILLTDWKNHSSYAEYSVFYVGDEYYNYTLTIGGYRGNAMDFMTYHNGMQFSTLDRDNDNYNGFDCVDWCGKGAWWHNHCCESSLNAVYANHDVRFPYGIAWNQFLVKTTRMMIKRK